MDQDKTSHLEAAYSGAPTLGPLIISCDRHLKSARSVLSWHYFMMRDLGLKAVKAPAGIYRSGSGGAGIEAFQRPLVLDALKEMNDWVWVGAPGVLEELS